MIKVCPPRARINIFSGSNTLLNCIASNLLFHIIYHAIDSWVELASAPSCKHLAIATEHFFHSFESCPKNLVVHSLLVWYLYGWLDRAWLQSKFIFLSFFLSEEEEKCWNKVLPVQRPREEGERRDTLVAR